MTKKHRGDSHLVYTTVGYHYIFIDTLLSFIGTSFNFAEINVYWI